MLKLAPGQVPYSMRDFGNTSSCTILVTMVSRLRGELLAKECEIVMCGFGSGLSWGAAHVRVGKIYCPEIIEI